MGPYLHTAVPGTLPASSKPPWAPALHCALHRPSRATAVRCPLLLRAPRCTAARLAPCTAHHRVGQYKCAHRETLGLLDQLVLYALRLCAHHHRARLGVDLGVEPRLRPAQCTRVMERLWHCVGLRNQQCLLACTCCMAVCWRCG
jgi:hypothetical protein